MLSTMLHSIEIHLGACGVWLRAAWTRPERHCTCSLAPPKAPVTAQVFEHRSSVTRSLRVEHSDPPPLRHMRLCSRNRPCPPRPLQCPTRLPHRDEPIRLWRAHLRARSPRPLVSAAVAVAVVMAPMYFFAALRPASRPASAAARCASSGDPMGAPSVACIAASAVATAAGSLQCATTCPHRKTTGAH